MLFSTADSSAGSAAAVFASEKANPINTSATSHFPDFGLFQLTQFPRIGNAIPDSRELTPHKILPCSPEARAYFTEEARFWGYAEPLLSMPPELHEALEECAALRRMLHE